MFYISRLLKKVGHIGFTSACLLPFCGCGAPTSTENQPTSAPSQSTTVNSESAPAPEQANSQTNDDNKMSPQIAYDQSFSEAVLTDVLDGQQLPLPLTQSGKKTGVLRMEVEKNWSSVKLVDNAGKPYHSHVVIQTSEGPIEIELTPEYAPNHVRNFLVLCKIGYYEGLRFERIIHQKAALDGNETHVDLIVAGCPYGTGDEGFGHLGYFVRAENREQVKHQEGSVGIWHEEDPDSAGTRFYITLGPAPALDGKFSVIGRVVKGLEIARKIGDKPTQNPQLPPDNEKPQTPIVIDKTTILNAKVPE